MAKEEIYDAIVVGSGATGGWAAKELTEKGMRVLVLEAGRNLDPEKDFTEHLWPYEVRGRSTASARERQKVQSKCYACNAYGRQFFVDDVDNPYTTADRKPFADGEPPRFPGKDGSDREAARDPLAADDRTSERQLVRLRQG